MSIFYFPDLLPLKLEHKKLNTHFENNKSLINDFADPKFTNLKQVSFIENQMTAYLEDTVHFMNENNIIPLLPKEIHIKYINNSNKEIFFKIVKDFFNIKPAQYNFPASTNIYDGTIYISSYYQVEYSNDNVIRKIQGQFGHNIQQTL